MKKIQLKQIGSFTKTHGIHGDLALYLNENVSFDLIDKGLIEKEAVFVEIDGIPVPFFISENGIRQLNDNTLLLRFDEMDEQEAAKLISCKVYLNTSELSEIEQKTNESPYDWIGYSVIDKKLKELGIVKEYIDLKENPMLIILHQKKELLVPLISDFIVAIDAEKKMITTNLPEGYIQALL